MSIKDTFYSVYIYDGLTDTRQGEFDFCKITQSPQSLLILMNLEEVMMWEKIKEKIRNKEDMRIMLGSKSI